MKLKPMGKLFYHLVTAIPNHQKEMDRSYPVSKNIEIYREREAPVSTAPIPCKRLLDSYGESKLYDNLAPLLLECRKGRVLIKEYDYREKRKK